jgi:transposase-like protein
MLAPTAHARHARVGVCVIASALPSCHPRRRQLSAAARRFFKCAVGTNGIPDRIAIDKSGANLAGLQSLNVILRYTGAGRITGIVQSKYLNNIIEQDHRFIRSWHDR